MTITGTAVGSAPIVTKDATFVLTLVDPCDPPVSVTGVSLGNQVYTLTDDSATPYIHPIFEIVPDYCPLMYSYSATSLNDGDTAVILPTSNDYTINFAYSKDLAPLGQTQTITVTAEAMSKYNFSTTKSDSRTFDLTFDNPCIDTDFVNIIAPTFTD